MKRYAATETRGESAWKREWSSFISGIEMKQVRDGTRALSLKASKDIEHEVAQQEEKSGSVAEAPTSYSYLFSSPAQKKAEREKKLQQQREEERQRRLERERKKKQKMRLKRQREGGEEEEESSDDEDTSKHQKTLKEAEKRGLKLEGMTRKEKRKFLQLTVTEEHIKAQEHAKQFKLHELMDEKLAWYQQGPHPIDLISEKLVKKKADKKGKQLGLKYNYLLPHPSWIAKRTQRRKESIMVALGRRFVFDDDGQAYDALRGVPVDMTKVNFLLTEPLFKEEGGAAGEEGTKRFLTVEDPRKIHTTFVRKVLTDKNAGDELRRANLSTNFLSSNIVKKPSVGLNDD
ncbi:hypothetical protein AGDE_07221 [Angomonas deanei]|nr:hypothetical protein AGDE_07221 [Angomonas deanei]|eukprot:EPY35823.1 hypothetical protein AGDE_07221 [Angomonas deanei]